VSRPILIGCEYSATVRDAFRALGFDAWSCDILPTTGDPSWHIQGDILEALRSRRWSAAIIHIPCTAMGVCGNKHYGRGKPRHHERVEAVRWSKLVWGIGCEQADCVAMENPASVLFPELKALGADVQYVQPWQHGHPEQKKTGLALHNLPRLIETNNVYDHMMTLPRAERERIFFMSPSEDRGLLRSKFYTGIADAMADQWGRHIVTNHGSQMDETQNMSQNLGLNETRPMICGAPAGCPMCGSKLINGSLCPSCREAVAA